MSKINGGLVLIDLSGKWDSDNSQYVDTLAHKKVLNAKGKKIFAVYTDLGVYACSCDGEEKTDSDSHKFYELVTGDLSFKVYADKVLIGDSVAFATLKARVKALEDA